MSDLKDTGAPERELRGEPDSNRDDATILPHRTPEAVALDLATMPARERAAWLSGYETGWVHRMAREHADYTQAIEDIAARYVRMVALDEEIERTLAETIRRGPFAAACDRRGDVARAARQRVVLRERGIWPVAP